MRKYINVGGYAGDIVRLPNGVNAEVLWFEPGMAATWTVVILPGGSREKIRTDSLLLVKRGPKKGGGK